MDDGSEPAGLDEVVGDLDHLAVLLA